MESAVTVDSLLGVASGILDWLIKSATTICNFMLSNPLVSVFIGISLAFVGFRVVARVIHR